MKLTSLDEIANITVAVLAIALTLTFYDQGLDVKPNAFIAAMAISILTVGIGFILHELAHKFVGMRYGAWAEFRASPIWLAIALGMAIIRFPIIFIAPGATYIYAPHITREQNGIISVAGPITNIVIAFGFAVLSTISIGDLKYIAGLGYFVNSFLALFNMIPIFPFDGSKVLAWNWVVWIAVTGLAAAMFFRLI